MMAKESVWIGGEDGKEGEPLDPALQGGHIALLVRVAYPGSKISDIVIGDATIQISNEDLRKVHRLHELVCDTEGG